MERLSLPSASNVAALSATATDALQSLRDEYTIVEVERHDVGHRAERDEIQQAYGVGVDTRRQRVALAQFVGQRGHHVERHTHASQRLRSEAVAGSVGVHDAGSGRQLAPWQMMVGHEHVDAVTSRLLDSVKRRNPVIHGHDEARLALGRNPHDFRREAVTEPEAIRHQEIRLLEA